MPSVEALVLIDVPEGATGGRKGLVFSPGGHPKHSGGSRGLNHPSAWKRISQKFACKEFSEGRIASVQHL
jgi:hypothetical protein